MQLLKMLSNMGAMMVADNFIYFIGTGIPSVPELLEES